MRTTLMKLGSALALASIGAAAEIHPRATASPAKDVWVPRLAGEYVNVYQPAGDVFPGPAVAGLEPGRFYREWVPNDHCLVRDRDGRWHAFGITHPLTSPAHIHAGEQLLFHAVAPPGPLKAGLREGSWRDLPKVLPPAERPGEPAAIHAPWILQRDGRFRMVYGPTPIRYAVSRDLRHWTPKGRLPGAPAGRDPQVFRWNGVYHLIVCGVHDVRLATSRDFRTWTEHGPILQMPAGVDPESPSVVRCHGTFYLFVCGWNGQWDRRDIQGAYQHKTYVFQSDNPRRFDRAHQVAVLDAHAPEILPDETGDWFISSVEWPHRGVSLAPLVWERRATGDRKEGTADRAGTGSNAP